MGGPHPPLGSALAIRGGWWNGGPRRIGRGPRRLSPGRGTAGQALVELALAMTVIVVLLGVAFTGWDAMHQAVGLTNAARAGAIVAANDYQNSNSGNALGDATAAVNAEEGQSGLYSPSSSPCTLDCVTVTPSTYDASGVTIDLVTVRVTGSVISQLPVVQGIRVTTTATARYVCTGSPCP